MSVDGHDPTGDARTSPVPDPESSADDALAAFIPEERPERSEFYDRVDLSAVGGVHARVRADRWGRERWRPVLARVRDACTGRVARAVGVFLLVGITGYTIRALSSAAEGIARRADTAPVIRPAGNGRPSPDSGEARPVVPPAREDPAVSITTPPVVSMNRAPPPVTIRQSVRSSARAVIEKPTRRAPANVTVAAPRVERTPSPRASGPTTQAATVPAPAATTGVAPVELTDVSALDRASSVIAPPAAAPNASPAAAPPLAPAGGISRRGEIESVLGRYANAFSSLDARRAKAVWPGVNERNLERAFDDLEQQEFNLGDCEITVLPTRALASCDGTARYTPKMGNRKERIESRRWTFQLRQSAQDWFIESVVTR